MKTRCSLTLLTVCLLCPAPGGWADNLAHNAPDNASPLPPAVGDGPERADEVYARRKLHDARLLRAEGRVEAAARVCARGVALDADNAALHRLCSELLSELGREQEAAPHRRLAEELAPLRPPPDTALDLDASGLWVVVLPPSDESGNSQDQPFAKRLEDPAALHLAERIAIRLPKARIRHAIPGDPATEGSVASGLDWLRAGGARAVLSLEVERVRCAESVKDGRFALARIRAAVAAAGAGAPVRSTHSDAQINLPEDGQCREHALSRALEGILDDPNIRQYLASGSPGIFTRTDILALFPALERRVARELDEGRRLARMGQLAAASQHYRAALRVDPDDPDAGLLLGETERARSLSRELSLQQQAGSGKGSPGDGGAVDGDLDPRFPPAQVAAMEQQVREEQRRRTRLLAALEALESDTRPPSAETIAAMRPGSSVPSRGSELAQAHTTGSLRTLVLYAPDGAPLARYYFAANTSGAEVSGQELLVREEDTRDDGDPDRWLIFDRGVRREVWESSGPEAAQLHMVYDTAGKQLTSVEIQEAGASHPHRVFHYSKGSLVSESRDSNGDGRYDLLEHFDEGGGLVRREEDRDHDGSIDLRSHYRDGRLVQRDVLNSDFADSPI